MRVRVFTGDYFRGLEKSLMILLRNHPCHHADNRGASINTRLLPDFVSGPGDAYALLVDAVENNADFAFRCLSGHDEIFASRAVGHHQVGVSEKPVFQKKITAASRRRIDRPGISLRQNAVGNAIKPSKEQSDDPG